MTEEPQNPFGVYMTAAIALRELFESFVAAGFTEDQALELTKVAIQDAKK